MKIISQDLQFTNVARTIDNTMLSDRGREGDGEMEREEDRRRGKGGGRGGRR